MALRDDPEPEQQRQFWGIGVGVPQLDGAASVAALQRFRAGVPWESVLHSWNLLDSHDTARFRTIAGSRDRHLVGVGLQMTRPACRCSSPATSSGSRARWGEDARRTMPWDRPESWDAGFLEQTRTLVALRRSLPALARGGMRFVHVGADAIAFLRETRDERLLVPRRTRGARGRSRTPFTRPRDDLRGATRSDGVLPAHGPAFHIWRIG